MIHIYCGDGKGKTTAAMGLALREAGHGRRVIIAQFLKNAGSGERAALAMLPTVELLPVPQDMKFTFRMTQEEKRAETVRQSALLIRAFQAAERADLLVLDELCAALSSEMVELERVLKLLKACPSSLEVVITGRNPPPQLLEQADYITEMKKQRHPYERGIAAREGVEW